jgi:DNA-binding NarL/FixJ family response regulator/DNA-binding SARP family transcriptional activator
MSEDTPGEAVTKVLVVDDHPAVREGLARILRAAGYAVFEAGDGEQAVDIAAWLQPDLVLMDVLMPGISGIDATERITARDPAPRVLMLSVSDSPETIRAAMQAGAAGYMTKAATSGSFLLEALRRTAAGERVFVPAGLLDDLAEDLGSLPPDGGRLTAREEAIAALAAKGAANSDIAAVLLLSPRTVENHLSRIYRKLGITSRAHLAGKVADLQIDGSAWTGTTRGIVLADIAAFATRSTRNQLVARAAFYQILREAFTRSGIPWSASHLTDRGDGGLVVVPPSVPVSKLIHPFLDLLAESLERHNSLTAERENMQLRVALDFGPVRPDDLGISGEVVIRGARLLDAKDFRAALQASGSSLGVIVSEPAYDMAVSQGIRSLDPAAIQHVDIGVKDMQTSAWMWFTGSALPPALRPGAQEAGRILDESASAEAGETLQAMRFRVLGPMEVWSEEGWTPIGAAKWRSLLACLLLRAGQRVSTESLIFELWGDDPPAKANNLISIYVHRLRRLIGDTEGRTLVYRAPGYMLRVADGGTDVQRFEIMVREAREALALGDPHRAAARLDEALSLWRGQPLADIPPSPCINEGTERLAELQLDAIELKIAADMECGGRDQVIPKLRRLLAEHPLREGLWLLLMRALDETGRHADALATYGQAREVISRELGVDPGAALSRMYADMLSQDPARPDLTCARRYRPDLRMLILSSLKYLSIFKASSLYRQAVACEIPKPAPRRRTSGRSRNHARANTACFQQVRAHVPFRVPISRR